MRVLIKDMEKPKSCYAVIDGESEYCPFVNTDDDCVLLLKKGICEGTWEEQYSKCPLVETPEPCEDAVSRQAALHALGAYDICPSPDTLDDDEITELYTRLMDIRAINNLPPVTPKPKTGKWIEELRGIMVTAYRCSECGRFVRDDTGYDVAKDYPFCHCGAKMEAAYESMES